MSECNAGTAKLWNTIKSLNGNPSRNTNEGIYFNDKVIHDPKKIANKFNQQFTPSSNKRSSKAFRRTTRNIRKPTQDPEITITVEQTTKAIKKSKCSKAMGPDNISPIMLKNIGPKGIQYLTNIYNNSINRSIVPMIWKTARIIPLPKPGKESNQGPSYRPISLLSPAAKTLEAIIQPEIADSIELKDHQHGFRKSRSTTTALQGISDHIIKGLNIKKPVKRTVLVAIDLSKAFDTVDHEILLNDINELPLNQRIKRFLFAYLRGRQTYVEFRGKKSKCRIMRQGSTTRWSSISTSFQSLHEKDAPTPTRCHGQNLC